ncbi:histone-like nucleoid-structuring protein H-NS [Pseudogulbenkiania sp. NH8B]|uniref:H-NS family nucleoid-associated regulatory protein n=1 Tax=Pseudogulbenkiania sp. (strain NH8B) TaxID=748280 RepID=UPI0002279A0D|nr:H-NS histone family protein [Pseudogulbenkiania sp. NH8B]BAK75773.1 histone-like nucleoid-structuring protein H-NS [Pseudogulbenkiania sp. NH8B]
MSGQIELCLVATGQQAAVLLPPDVRRRLADNHLRGRQVFYAMGSSAGDVMVWAGRGQRPGWVQEWLAKGGTLEQLAAHTDLLENAA